MLFPGVMQIGPGNWAPEEENDGKKWKLVHSGPNFAVWEAA